MLADDVAPPLTGFMRERQYLQALYGANFAELDEDEQADDSTPTTSSDSSDNAPIAASTMPPIVLAIDDEQKARCETATHVRLVYQGKLVAALRNIELYAHRKRERAAGQFATVDERHPNVKLVLDSGDWLIGDDIELLERVSLGGPLDFVLERARREQPTPSADKPIEVPKKKKVRDRFFRCDCTSEALFYRRAVPTLKRRRPPATSICSSTAKSTPPLVSSPTPMRNATRCESEL